MDKYYSFKEEIAFGEDKNIVVYIEIKELSELDLPRAKELVQQALSEIQERLFGKTL